MKSEEVYAAQRIKLLQQLNPSGRYFDMLVEEQAAAVTERLQAEVAALEQEAYQLDYALAQADMQLVECQRACDVPREAVSQQNGSAVLWKSKADSSRYKIEIPEKYQLNRGTDFSQQFPERFLTPEQICKLEAQLEEVQRAADTHNEQVRVLNALVQQRMPQHQEKLEEARRRFLARQRGKTRSWPAKQREALDLFPGFAFGGFEYASSREGAHKMLEQVCRELRRLVSWAK